MKEKKVTYRAMFEPECLDQVHGTILHPVGHLEDMLVSLKIWSLGTLKDKADEYWERKKLNEAPKKELQHCILP